MALTKEELAEVEALIARLRGLGMGFAACDPEELARLERLASSSANVVWFVDPTLAREKGAAIDRHLRFVRASVAYARTCRELLEEEIAELPTRRASTRDASSSSPDEPRIVHLDEDEGARAAEGRGVPADLFASMDDERRPATHCGVCGKPRAEWSDTRPGKVGPDVRDVGHLCRGTGAPIGGCMPGAPAASKCTRCGARPGGFHTTPDRPTVCSVCGRPLVEGHAPGCLRGARFGG